MRFEMPTKNGVSRRSLLKRIAVDLAVVLMVVVYMASFPVATIAIQYAPRPVQVVIVPLHDVAYTPLRWYASRYDLPGGEAYGWYCLWARGRTEDACIRASNRW
jgi:hypothetical protein